VAVAKPMHFQAGWDIAGLGVASHHSVPWRDKRTENNVPGVVHRVDGHSWCWGTAARWLEGGIVVDHSSGGILEGQALAASMRLAELGYHDTGLGMGSGAYP
jgi:hypothetical protein